MRRAPSAPVPENHADSCRFGSETDTKNVKPKAPPDAPEPSNQKVLYTTGSDDRLPFESVHPHRTHRKPSVWSEDRFPPEPQKPGDRTERQDRHCTGP